MDGRYLMARRAPEQHLAEFWEFPGGKQEENETLQECLEREILEELNLIIRATNPVCESIYSYDRGEIKLIAIHAAVLSGELRLSVHDRAEWLTPSEILKLKLAPADIPIAQYLFDTHGN